MTSLGLKPNQAVCKAHQFKNSIYNWFTADSVRQLAQSGAGNPARLYAAMERYLAGGKLTVAVVGGSISAGQGAVDAPAWPNWMYKILSGELPDGLNPQRLVMNNGAVPGTVSQYMSTCHNVHVPKEADIIFVEYAVNDEEMPLPHMNNQVTQQTFNCGAVGGGGAWAGGGGGPACRVGG